uniref:Uncharacterized protein n=1 Tax=Thermosporothrix sp. COM3 TaxID=2490863 RepID=A0A455SSD1_9CHLR|nr:hypothetical protein KTC_28150 [Thermosporothrix sp. COM3]
MYTEVQPFLTRVNDLTQEIETFRQNCQRLKQQLESAFQAHRSQFPRAGNADEESERVRQLQAQALALNSAYEKERAQTSQQARYHYDHPLDLYLAVHQNPQLASEAQRLQEAST